MRSTNTIIINYMMMMVVFIRRRICRDGGAHGGDGGIVVNDLGVLLLLWGWVLTWMLWWIAEELE